MDFVDSDRARSRGGISAAAVQPDPVRSGPPPARAAGSAPTAISAKIVVGGGFGEHPAGFGSSAGGGVDQDGFGDAGEGVDHGAD